MAVKRIAVLGSTGSIGVNTLAVVAAHPERYQVVALGAGGGQAERLIAQARQFRPELVGVWDPSVAKLVAQALQGTGVEVMSGEEGITAVATHPGADMTLSAIVGAAGLRPTFAAIRAGKDIALANKECLVMAGALFMDEVARQGVRLIPVDSEHSALFQVLYGGQRPSRLILTASGGPFRGWSQEQLQTATLEQALRHPKWAMGPKITIDSATMMNKGLEVIEAHWLFAMPPERIEVLVHPESIIHSIAQYDDGSQLAQLGMPDMRTPIAVALAWPERIPVAVPRLDLASLGCLTFYPAPDQACFPCLEMAYHALRLGGTASVVLNAANEAAVEAFLQGHIPFASIPQTIAHTLETIDSSKEPNGIEELYPVDQEARRVAREWMARKRGVV